MVSARPSFVLGVVLCLGALLAPAAQAQPPLPPVLTGTSPESPGTTTTPRLLGREGGVGTSVAARALHLGGTRAIDENAIVDVYTDPTCSGGSLLKSGTLGELETNGIEVIVAPSLTTHLYATLTDPAQPGVPSECSAGIAYRHVSGAPPVPVVAAVSPPAPADDNIPRVSGSAEEGVTVAIFADPACAGPALAAGSAAAFNGAGIAVTVPDNSTTTFYARASWAGMSSDCSTTSVTYQEVSATATPGGGSPGDPPPSATPAVPAPIPGRPAPPKLHTEPGGRANNANPLVAGSAPGAVGVAIFAGGSCDGAAVATGSAAELRVGIPLRVAPNSTTVFSGISIAADGDRSGCTPDPVTYVEDSLPPLTRITFGPGVKTRKRSPVFRFADLTGDPPGTVFLCKVDRRPWAQCQSPLRLKRLRPRRHVLRVRAIDAAGNGEAAGAKRSFRVTRPQRR